MLESEGQVRDEMQIETVNGKRVVRLYKGALFLEDGILLEEVYFAVSTNMLSRGYKLLLHSQIFEGERKTSKRG